jgi:prefoldin subunit 5
LEDAIELHQKQQNNLKKANEEYQSKIQEVNALTVSFCL